MSGEARTDRLAGLVMEEELDQLLVGDLVNPSETDREAGANLRWLTGFTGTSGLVVIGSEERIFFTDFRYAERAAREVAQDIERVVIERGLISDAAKRLHGRVGYDDAHTSVKNLGRLTELAPEGVELVPAGGLVERLRRHKDEAELAAIAEAARLTDQVYEWVFSQDLVGRTERDVMLAIHQRMRELGAEDPSFPAIVGAGENSALPHHESSDREIGAREILLIDMGAIVDGYCSDGTRTVATGELDNETREVYEVVRLAQVESLEAIRKGVSGPEADAVAREKIIAAGYGEEFGHGLGHGVGIQVHEAPRLSKRSEDILAPGDVVTVEPGIYLQGRFGVRIEDLVTVTDNGARNLSTVPKELRVIG
ncbi:MAG: aminopeptidase P family protein [Solirubrobacterales bacterium]